MVISRFPIGGNGDADRGRPVAALRRGVFGSGMGRACDVFHLPNGDLFRAEASEFGGKFRGGAGDVESDVFTGRVTDTAGIAFDRCRAERDGQKENGENREGTE